MFFIVNKEKVYAYIVTLSIIGILFTISVVMPNKSIETGSKVLNNNIDNIIENGIIN